MHVRNPSRMDSLSMPRPMKTIVFVGCVPRWREARGRVDLVERGVADITALILVNGA